MRTALVCTVAQTQHARTRKKLIEFMRCARSLVLAAMHAGGVHACVRTINLWAICYCTWPGGVFGGGGGGRHDALSSHPEYIRYHHHRTSTQSKMRIALGTLVINIELNVCNNAMCRLFSEPGGEKRRHSKKKSAHIHAHRLYKSECT